MSVLGRSRGPVVAGHRGGRGEGWPPENTLAAFERARREGAHAVELDVRLAADEVVVLHDPTLLRVTDSRDARAVAGLSWADVSRVRLGHDATVARLDDVLDWASGAGLALNVELKHDVPDRLSLGRAVARRLRAARVPVLVSSFDPLLLLVVGALAPALPRALLTDPRQSYASVLHELARPSLLAGLNVERSQATAARLARWKRRRLSVGVWTVNEPDEARRLVRLGADLLITDRPGVLVRALGV